MKFNDTRVDAIVDWVNPPSVKDLKADYTSAKSIHNDHIEKINEWLELFEARRKKGDVTKSSTRPKTIKKQAKWTYPSIEEPILSNTRLFDIQPRTHEDREAAFYNSLILQYQWDVDIDIVKFVNESTRVFVNTGTLIVKTGWERTYETKEVEKPITRMQQVYVPDGSITFQEVQVGTEMVREEVIKFNKPTVEVKDYRTTIIDPGANGNIKRAQFVIEEYESNVSDLRKKSIYKNLNLINVDKKERLTDEQFTKADEDNFNFKDDPRKIINVIEYWGYWDIHNTGKTELIVATFVGDIMIGLEENPTPYGELPYDVAHFEPVIGSNYGEPDAEIIKDNQENIGAMKRAVIDLLGRSANGQVGMAEGFLNIIQKKKYQKGEDYTYNPNFPEGTGIREDKVPEIPNSAYNFITAEQNEVDSITGRKSFGEGITGNGLGSTATGVRSAMSSTAKREMGILRRYAKLMESVGLKIISMNQEYLQDGEIFRITNSEYLIYKRDKFAGNFDMKISVSTPEQDRQDAEQTVFMLQTLGNTFPMEFTQILLEDLATINNKPTLAQKIKDFEQKPDPLQQEKVQLEIELLKAQIEMFKSSSQENLADVEEKMAKAEEIRAKVDLLDLDFIHKSDGEEHERDMAKQALIRDTSLDLEQLKQNHNKEKSK